MHHVVLPQSQTERDLIVSFNEGFFAEISHSYLFFAIASTVEDDKEYNTINNEGNDATSHFIGKIFVLLLL